MSKSAQLSDIRIEKNRIHYVGYRIVKTPGCGMLIRGTRTEEGLVAAKSWETVIVQGRTIPKYGSYVDLSWYHRGVFRLRQPLKNRDTTAQAVCAARGYLGLDGEPVPMPSGWYVRRGVLHNDVAESMYLLRDGYGLHYERQTSENDLELIKEARWEPLDNTPAEICRIEDPVAYEAAYQSYHASV